MWFCFVLVAGVCCAGQAVQSVQRLPGSVAQCSPPAPPAPPNLACVALDVLQPFVQPWNNPDRASGGGQFAESANLNLVNRNTPWLVASDFRFVLPGGAVVVGLEVLVDISSTRSDQLIVPESAVRLLANGQMFLSSATSSPFSNVPTSNSRQVLRFGAPNDMWSSNNPAPFDLNAVWSQSTFSIAIAIAHASGDQNRARVFSISGRLSYILLSTAPPITFPGGQTSTIAPTGATQATTGTSLIATTSGGGGGGGGGGNAGLYAGIALGVIVFLALILVVVVLVVRRRRRKDLMEPLLQSVDSAFDSSPPPGTIGNTLNPNNTSEVNSADMNSLAFALEAPIFKAK